MIRRFLIFGMTICLVSALPAPAGIQLEHLVGAWLFDDGKGDVVTDASGNGHDGEIIGPSWVDEGPFNSALEFHGAEDVVNVEHSDDLSLQMFTLMAWVKTSGSGQAIIHKQPSSDMRNYILNIYSTTFLRASFSSAGVRSDCDGTTAVNDDQWHHVAATYDQETLKVYVDGELDGEISSPNKVLENNQEPLRIGHAGGTGGYRYVGLMDEVAIYNIALSENEIRFCMEKGLTEVLAVAPVFKLTTLWSKIKSD